MQKVQLSLLKKLQQIVIVHYILGSFQSKKVLFHHSLTVLLTIGN